MTLGYITLYFIIISFSLLFILWVNSKRHGLLSKVCQYYLSYNLKKVELKNNRKLLLPKHNILFLLSLRYLQWRVSGRYYMIAYYITSEKSYIKRRLLEKEKKLEVTLDDIDLTKDKVGYYITKDSLSYRTRDLSKEARTKETLAKIKEGTIGMN